MKIETKQVAKATEGSPARHLVLVDGRTVGQLEKFNDTHSECHPWKAFVGVGMFTIYIGAYNDCPAAIRAVVAAKNPAMPASIFDSLRRAQ